MSGAKGSEGIHLDCSVRRLREKRAIMHNQFTLLMGQQAKEVVGHICHHIWLFQFSKQ